MRLLLTADLHYNHGKSRPTADDVIGRMNAAGGDVVVVVGDAAVADGDWLERCLGRFTHAGPKLFVAGNHELWTHGPDSYAAFMADLPRRVRDLGWRWLETDPFVAGDVAVVGTVGLVRLLVRGRERSASRGGSTPPRCRPGRSPG